MMLTDVRDRFLLRVTAAHLVQGGKQHNDTLSPRIFDWNSRNAGHGAIIRRKVVLDKRNFLDQDRDFAGDTSQLDGLVPWATLHHKCESFFPVAEHFAAQRTSIDSCEVLFHCWCEQ